MTKLAQYVLRCWVAGWLGIACMTAVTAQQPERGLWLRSVARATQCRVQPGGVLILNATAINSGTERAQGTLVVSLDGVPHQQSARRVSVGPQAAETVDIYTALPSSIAGQERLNIKVTMFVEENGRQVILSRGGQPAEQTLTLAVDRLPTLAALVMDPEPPARPSWYWPPPAPQSSYELAVASRISAGNTRQTANFDVRALPINVADWDVMDTIIVSEPSVMGNSAFLESLRLFLSQGGRAWFMADRIPVDSLRPLLAADQSCIEVDEVELNELTVKLVGATLPVTDQELILESDRPYRMKRVLQSGGRVTHMVDDWPVAIWMPIGSGEMLITTLDSAAWLEPNLESTGDVLRHSSYLTRSWAGQLATNINVQRLPQPLQQDVDYPLEQIGNPVVPRPWVAVALSAFCIVLALLGAWRTWVGEMSLLGLLAPFTAVAVSGALLFASSYVRRDIPESLSRLQLVHVAEDGGVASIREQAAVYLEDAREMSLESPVDGRAVVDEQVTSGVRRLEITDFQQWKLVNSDWPPGLWRYRTHFAQPTDQLVAYARLTEQDIEIELPTLPADDSGKPLQLEDMVLRYVVGDPLLCSAGTDSATGHSRLQASGERWITDTLMTDEQRRRSLIYQQFFSETGQLQRRGRVLCGWTDLWTSGPSWSRELAQRGAALVELPIRLVRPPAGREVFVPHGLVRQRRDPSQVNQTFAFNDESGRWARELTMATEAHLQFDLPQQLLPFQVSEVEVELDIKAPKRNVRLLCHLPSGPPFEIVQLENPSIPWQAKLDDPQLLAAASTGKLNVELRVSERTDVADQRQQTNVIAWEVDRLHFSFRGQTPEPATP